MRELNFIMREKFRGDIPFKWELHTVSIIEIPEIQLNAARTFRVLFSRNQLNAARTFRVMFPEINWTLHGHSKLGFRFLCWTCWFDAYENEVQHAPEVEFPTQSELTCHKLSIFFLTPPCSKHVLPERILWKFMSHEHFWLILLRWFSKKLHGTQYFCAVVSWASKWRKRLHTLWQTNHPFQ